MNSIQSLKKIVLTMCIGMGLTAPALANMLLTDLTLINVPSVADRNWTISTRAAKELQIECANCDQQVLVNIRLAERNHFGSLGPEAAKKAKKKCNRSLDQLLQCDTIVGMDHGNVSGLMATKKILDNFYISSIILGDETTLLKMTTKASSKLEADGISRRFFEAVKKEMILR